MSLARPRLALLTLLGAAALCGATAEVSVGGNYSGGGGVCPDQPDVYKRDMCGPEALGQVAAGFAGHLDRAATCPNTTLWYTRSTKLGAGMTGRVDRAVSLCGTRFVVKASLHPSNHADRGQDAVQWDCTVLRHLAQWAVVPPHLQQPPVIAGSNLASGVSSQQLAYFPRYYGSRGRFCFSEDMHPASRFGSRRRHALVPSPPSAARRSDPLGSR
jgi:hypothetical protein